MESILLFAANNEVGQLVMFTFIFLVMTAVWCGLVYYLVNHGLLAERGCRVERYILPFVLIMLGIFVLAEAFLLLLCLLLISSILAPVASATFSSSYLQSFSTFLSLGHFCHI